MEVTIDLPEQILASISRTAIKSRKRIAEVISDHISRDFSSAITDIEKQISLCSNDEIIRLTHVTLPPKKDRRLRELIGQQAAKQLSKTEQKELWNLMEENRLATLKKAFALREMQRRNLNGTNQ